MGDYLYRTNTNGSRPGCNHVTHARQFYYNDKTDTEDNLQKAAYKSNQIITEYGLNISVQKTKSMAFKGRDPVRTKIVITKL